MLKNCLCGKSIHANKLKVYCERCEHLKRILYGMVARCTNKESVSYKWYGARGIKVCERWLDFKNFLADMGGSFKYGLQIDRKNFDGDYEPSNCRWTTPHIQRVNQRKKMKCP